MNYKPIVKKNGSNGWQLDLRGKRFEWFRNSLDKHQSRLSFKSRSEAEAKAEEIRLLIENHGFRKLDESSHYFNQDAMIYYAKLLHTKGKTLIDAAKYYLKYLNDSEESLSVGFAGPLMERFVDYCHTDKNIERRPATLKSIRYLHRKIAPHFSDLLLHDITRQRIDNYLTSLNGLSPQSVRHHLAFIKQFFNFLKREGIWKKGNPTYGLVRRAQPPIPQIYSIEEVNTMLRFSKFHNIWSRYYPIQLLRFMAGIRRDECLRLDWSSINFDSGYITIDSSRTKTLHSRSFELMPILLKELIWFRNHHPHRSLVYGIDANNGLKRLEGKCNTAFGFRRLQNGARHTFATMRALQCESMEKTANELGHNLNVLKRHYKALSTKATADDYFSMDLSRPLSL